MVGRKFSGPLIPGTTSVRQVNRRNKYYKKTPFRANSALTTNAKTNKKAIITLDKRLKSLQLSNLGQYQKKMETFSWVKETDAAPHQFTATHPLCFCTNQFVGGKTAAPALAPQLAPWYKTASGYVGNDFRRWDTHLQPVTAPTMNAFWADKDNTCSAEVYQPLGTRLKFDIQYQMNTGSQPEYVRIDIIRPRKELPISDHRKLTLPESMGQFARIAETSSLTSRNQINPTYWKIIKTVWVKFSNHDQTTKLVRKFVTINRSFKNDKLIKPDIDATTTQTSQPDFHDNVPSRQLEWCIVSCSSSNAPTQISVIRNISWRDQHGVSA